MISRSLTAVALSLALFLGSCGGGSDAVKAARADLRAGQLEAAERKLEGVETSEAVDLRAAIEKVRKERESVASKVEEILSKADSSTENQLRERLKTLRDRTVDPVARESVSQTLSDLKERLVARGGAGKARDEARAQESETGEPAARGDARDELIARIRADVREALADRQWRRADELLWMLSEQPRERVGDLAGLRGDLLSAARSDAAAIAGQARKLATEQDAATARDWLRGHLERFPAKGASETLVSTLRDLEREVARAGTPEPEPTPAEAGAREPTTYPARSDLLDPKGAAIAELLLAPPVPEDRDADALVLLARESAARDELAYARQCWLAASRKLLPGDLRDDYIGEAQDLRARITLRAELIDAFRATPALFTNLGIDGVSAAGWSEGGVQRPWSGQYLDVYKRLSAQVELSSLARRGIVCELLRSPDAAERDRAITDLGQLVERGDVASVDAANMVARARGGIGASERWLLEKGRWVTSAESVATASAEVDLALSKAFLKADPEERDAAFEKLLAGASEMAARKALRDRAVSALKALERDKSASNLEALADVRRELDLARKAALDLIFDENVYFYPYNPPEPPRTAGDYARAQQRVDELVDAVRAVLQRSRLVKLSRDFRAACEEVEWCRAAHADLKLEFELPESCPEYLLVQDPALAEIDLLSFAWTAQEAKDLAYDRSILRWNERQFMGYARRRDTPADETPNVAEQEQVRITNRYRMLMGRRAVAWNPRIQVAAQGHSEYMANTGDFGHFEKGDPARSSPFDRMRLAGYPRGASENCAMVGGDPQAAHDGWLHSSGHHRNILMSGHREMASANASNYWTQNFGADTSFQKELEQ